MINMKQSRIIEFFNYKNDNFKIDYFERKSRKKRFNLLVWAAVIMISISAAGSIEMNWDKIYEKYSIESIYTQIKQYPFAVVMLDSGSANCALILCGGQSVLVDCGQEKAEKNVLDVLKIMNIDEIDLAVLTHPDKDHIGNFEQVTDAVTVHRFVTCENGSYELSSYYNRLIKKLGENNIIPETAKAEDRFTYDELILEVISPEKVYDKSNDNSLVIKASYRDNSVLLTGDISKKAEEDILRSSADISANVLLVAHHGSSSSTSQAFLESVAPEYAVISVQQEDYLPNDSTLERLIDYGCRLYRTDYFGNIAALSDGKEIKIVTEYDDYRGE